MLHTFLANLSKAARDSETISLGGGTFSPSEIKEVLREVHVLIAHDTERLKKLVDKQK